jgi:SAM-dependent methyltransferase
MGQMIPGDLSRIDWDNHDGVNRAMINDFVRNQFYDRALAGCQQQVVDIGFGTGLLSMLALKHGARQVVAFESDPDRYLLGQAIIENLGLGDRIELRHVRYDHSMAAEFAGWTFVTETVNGNLWQEGIWNSLPRQQGAHFVPHELGVEFYATVVPDSFAFGLVSTAADPKIFVPGVDVDARFVREINVQMSLAYSGYTNDPGPGIIALDLAVDTAWGWIPYMRCFNPESRPCAQYYLDVGAATWRDCRGLLDPVDFDQTHRELILHLPQEHAVLVVARAVLKHGEHSLYLDMGHWGPMQRPIIANRCQGPITVRHDLRTGDISYHQED